MTLSHFDDIDYDKFRDMSFLSTNKRISGVKLARRIWGKQFNKFVEKKFFIRTEIIQNINLLRNEKSN